MDHRDRARRALSVAAMRGILSGVAIAAAAAAAAACSKQTTTITTAPMEATSAPSASATVNPLIIFPSGPSTAPIAIETQPKDCCRGKNDCKGKSGCAVSDGKSACSGSAQCKGLNECKGKGTSCDDAGDDNNNSSVSASPVPRATGPGRSGGGQPQTSPTKPGNCCSGKNECKGKSGCRSARNPAGAGMNECKGKGTSCPRRH